MKNRVIRHKSFETNSSSSHSISIASGEFIPDKLLVENGVCEIFPGEFGRSGPDDYTDAATKAAYCLTYLEQYGKDDYRTMLDEVIRKATGAKEVKFVESSDEHYKWGYIDHQSDIVCAEAFLTEESLRQFIFNQASVLTIDHDNH